MPNAKPLPPAPPPLPRRRRLRFTLRLLLAGITLLCLALGVWTHRAREQRRIVRAIEQSEHGRFYYDYQFQYDASEVPGQNSKLPKSLVDLFGVDYFHSVAWVSVNSRELLADISNLHAVEEIEINDPMLTDQHLIPISRMRNLKELTVNWPWPEQWTPSKISDETLRRIGRMPNIVDVQIGSRRFTRNGVQELIKAPRLEYADLWGCELVGEVMPLELPSGKRIFHVKHDIDDHGQVYATNLSLK